jgi:hypothetical protein
MGMNYQQALDESGLGEKYRSTNRMAEGWGDISEEAIKLVLRCSRLEGCSPELLAFTWQEESSYNFYPPPNTNNTDDFTKWDFGPMQLNYEQYIANVANGYFRPSSDEDEVFGLGYPHNFMREAFTGNPFLNVRAGARWLARISKDPKGRTFDSTDAMKAGIYTGADRVEHRAAKFTRWQGVLKTFFEMYQPKKPV